MADQTTETETLGVADVATLTRPQREARVERLTVEADRILLRAIDQHVLRDRREVAAIVTLFSGGNDSTVLAHLFRERATHAGHANTTIGIEQTREFVRNTCEEWGLPLLERTSKSESDSYRSLVLDQGFPGPGHHFKMFQRLKERAIEQMQRELIANPYRQRVIFLAGRDDIPEHRKTWGWGADPNVLRKTKTKASKVGALCPSCDDRFIPGLEAIA